MALRSFFSTINWFLSEQVGIDIRKGVFFIIRTPRFFYDYIKFRSLNSGKVGLRPCLHDKGSEGGDAKSEYFLQDLIVARWIFEQRPLRHIDIGSRVDGFVAHVASFRAIEVFDVRPVTANIPGVKFRQIDMLSDDHSKERCDSLSCLHALEHFGLGRYGDPLDSKGFEKGFAAMASMVQPGGRFYLSVPIGRPRVEFNAHRIVAPRVVVDLASNHGFQLAELTVLARGEQESMRQPDQQMLLALESRQYALGIFIFDRTHDSRPI